MRLSLSVNYPYFISKGNLVDKIVNGVPIKREHYLEHISTWVKDGLVEGVELVIPSNLNESDIKKIKETFSIRTIPILSIHQPIFTLHKIIFEEITSLMETANKLSAEVAVIHLISLGKNITDENYINNLKRLEKKYQVKIGIENSSKNILTSLVFGFARQYAWHEDEFTQIIKDLNLNITFDTTHLGLSKKGVVNFFLNNKTRIINIHLSDYIDDYFRTHLPLGKGRLPINEFILTLVKNNYQGLLTLETNSNIEVLYNNIQMVNKYKSFYQKSS